MSSHVELKDCNRKRAYRIYCTLALNLRMEPRQRLKQLAIEPLKGLIKPDVAALKQSHEAAFPRAF